jgi:hypothetical protein
MDKLTKKIKKPVVGELVVLVWEDYPERTRVFLLAGLTASEHKMTLDSNGHFVNTPSENPSCLELCEWLEKHRPVVLYDSQLEDGEMPQPATVDVCRIVVSGFAM